MDRYPLTSTFFQDESGTPLRRGMDDLCDWVSPGKKLEDILYTNRRLQTDPEVDLKQAATSLPNIEPNTPVVGMATCAAWNRRIAHKRSDSKQSFDGTTKHGRLWVGA